MPARIEVHEPGRPPRELTIDGVLEVGRECDGLVLADLGVSRRHLQLAATDDLLTVTDLGSTNGTTINGAALTASSTAATGDVIGLGDTTLVVLGAFASRPTALPASDGFVEIDAGRNVVRYRKGTHAETVAGEVAVAARRAQRRLADLAALAPGKQIRIRLVDPFPDPGRPGEIVAGGTLVDATRAEVWLVATPESPPEPLERPLALCLAAGLPAAAALAVLIEGYALHVAGTPDPAPLLRGCELPALAEAEGDHRPAMALSFVRYLLDRGGVSELLRLLREARSDRVDGTVRSVYGQGLAELEQAWRRSLAAGQGGVPARQFVKLSLRYLRPHRRREAEIFLYMLLGLAFTMVYPFAFRRLLDSAIPSGEYSEVAVLLGALGAAFAVSLLAGLRRAYLSSYVSGAVVRELRTEMFGRLQTLSARWFSSRQQGDVLSRLFSDVGQVEAGLSQTLRDGVFQGLSLLVATIVMMTLDPVLGVVVLVGAPVVGLVYRSMSAGARRRSTAVQEQMSGVMGVAAENYNAQAVVKAFGLENAERERFRRSAGRMFASQRRLQLFGGLFGLSVNLIVTALRIVVLALGAWLILEERLTVGGLVAFTSVMGEVLSPVAALTGLGQQLQSATGALARVQEILEAVPDVDDAPAAPPLPPLSGAISITDATLSYTAGRPVLRAVSCEISAGSRVAFVGPSGAGKSTVLQLLMRFYDPDEGVVRFDGHDLREVTASSLRSQLGVVFQDSFLFDATVRDNIAAGKPDASDAEVVAAAEAAELHEFITSLPRGYDTPVGERGGRLSGGQRQRLAIARALVRDPRVLLLDEATSALDPRTERLIAETLDRVGQGRTTIAVTHRLGTVTGYDRIFVMRDGQIVEQGTHAELVTAGGVYAELWAEQAGTHTDASFDVAAALARIPLFEGLNAGQLAELGGRMQTIELAAGDSIPEGGGQLAVIRSGRGRVLVAGLAGDRVPIADLGPGDCFGLAALLGAPQHSVLQAATAMLLLTLDDEAIAASAAGLPQVSAALLRVAPAEAPPPSARPLSRMTLYSGAFKAVEASAPPPVPAAADEVRRLTGSFPAQFQ